MKFLAGEPVAAIMGLATAINLCVTAFCGSFLNPAQQTAAQAVISALFILWARSQTSPSQNGAKGS